MLFFHEGGVHDLGIIFSRMTMVIVLRNKMFDEVRFPGSSALCSLHPCVPILHFNPNTVVFLFSHDDVIA